MELPEPQLGLRIFEGPHAPTFYNPALELPESREARQFPHRLVFLGRDLETSLLAFHDVQLLAFASRPSSYGAPSPAGSQQLEVMSAPYLEKTITSNLPAVHCQLSVAGSLRSSQSAERFCILGFTLCSMRYAILCNGLRTTDAGGYIRAVAGIYEFLTFSSLVVIPYKMLPAAKCRLPATSPPLPPGPDSQDSGLF